MRPLCILFALSLAACSAAEGAPDKPAPPPPGASVIGMSHEQIFACMGPPQRKDAEGTVEMWSYAAIPTTLGNALQRASMSMLPPDQQIAALQAQRMSPNQLCRINVVLSRGVVSAVNFQGSRGLYAPDRQCAYLIKECNR
jgi:hypothetical protein